MKGIFLNRTSEKCRLRYVNSASYVQAVHQVQNAGCGGHVVGIGKSWERAPDTFHTEDGVAHLFRTTFSVAKYKHDH